MKNMVDLHTHILPGMDDGAGSWEDSLRMARMAAECGVRCIAATPHSCGNGTFDPAMAGRVRQGVSYLQKKLDEQQIPIVLVTGMEILADEGMAHLLREGSLLSYGDTLNVLVEFRFDEDPVRTLVLLEELTGAGYVPLVAHPERYPFVQQEPDLAADWVAQGCFLQVNQGSLLGRFGMEAGICGRELLGRGLVSAIASDAHSPVRRTTDMSEMASRLEYAGAPGVARRLLSENPLRILQGLEPLPVGPVAFPD